MDSSGRAPRPHPTPPQGPAQQPHVGQEVCSVISSSEAEQTVEELQDEIDKVQCVLRAREEGAKERGRDGFSAHALGVGCCLGLILPSLCGLD